MNEGQTTAWPALERAVERGELPRDLDIDLAVDQLLGSIYYRVLLTGGPLPGEFTDLLVNRFFVQMGFPTADAVKRTKRCRGAR